MAPASSMTPTARKPHMTHNSCNTMINSHDQPLDLWEEHFECLQAMGPNGPYMTCEPKWVNTHMAHYSRNIMTNFGHHSLIFVKGEAFQVFSKEWAQMAPIWPVNPKCLNTPHGPLLKEHYDQLWPSLIDICKRRSISSIFQRMGPNGPYMTFDLKSLNTPYDPMVEDPYDQLWRITIAFGRRRSIL